MKLRKYLVCLFIGAYLLSAGRVSLVGMQGSPGESVAAGSTSRVSVDSAGLQGESGKASFNPSVSLDGAHTAFWSQAALVNTDTNAKSDIYVRTKQPDGNKTVRVSVATNGNQSNGDSYLPSISSSGRFVTFWSDGNNLVDNDTNTCSNYSITGTCPDIFMHDRDKAGDGIFDTPGDIKTVRVSVASDGGQANGRSLNPVISGDGRYVAFVSFASNLVPNDNNNQPDVFVYDLNIPNKIVRVSVSTEGLEANKPSGFTDRHYGLPAISANGRFVVFHSEATNLVTGDTNLQDDIFLHDRDTDNDGIMDETGAVKTIRISVSSEQVQADNWSLHPSISANGRLVVFTSLASNLVSGDLNGLPDVFLHDRDADGNGIFDETGAGIRTIRASVATVGTEANGACDFPALSSDGGFVAYRSAANNLVPLDTNAQTDIFLWERSTGNVSRISTDSSGVEGNGPSGASPNVTGPASFDRGAPSLSTLGRFISFHSLASNLVSGDTNGAADVFMHERSLDQPSTTTSTSSTTSSTTTSSTTTSSTTTTLIIVITTTSSTSTTSTTTTSSSSTTSTVSSSSTSTSLIPTTTLPTTTSTTTTTATSTTTSSTSTSSSSTTTTLPFLGPSTLQEFPQIAVGGGYRTHLVLYNPNNLSIQVTARLLSQLGLPLAVSVNGVTASTMNTVLTPLGSLNLRLEDSGDVKAGWCQVFSSWPISGLVIYQTVEGGKVISEATVYPSPRWKKTAVVAPQLGTNSDIGIAIANPWEYPVTGSMRLINSAGVVITTSNFSLGAGQQSAKFISQYFQGLTSIPEGVVEISSSQSLVAVGLLFQFQSAIQGNNVFTTIPILPLP